MTRECGAVLFCLFIGLTVAVDPLPASMMRGVAITPDGPFTLEYYATMIQLDEALNIGANWVFVNTYLSQMNVTSSTVFKGPQAPLDSALKSFIDVAHSKGLKVMLKPIVIPLDDTSWLLLDPENPSEWFESYTNVLCSYGTLLPGLDAYSVGLELTSLTIPHNYTNNWLQLISRVRQCSNAKLTYSSLFSLEWRRIQFWDELDWIGIDEYLPVSSSSNPYPSVAEMTDTIAEYFEQVRNFQVQQNLTSKPIVITETGIYSFTNATFSPAVFPPGVRRCNDSYSTHANFTTQQLYFEATFNAVQLNSDIISGIFMYQ